MSASREKKIRQEGVPLTEKQRADLKKAAAAKRNKVIYTVVAIVAAVAVVALLVWDSGVFQRGQTAVTIGDVKCTVADVDYYYYQIKNNYISQVEAVKQQYGFDLGYDTSLSPADQTYSTDETTGAVTTYADYFRQTALNTLQQAVALSSAAKSAGYTLSEEAQATITSQDEQINTYASQYGTDRLSILKQLHGPYVTEKIFAENLERAVLADDYLESYQSTVDTSQQAMDTYFQGHKDELDSFTYRYAFLDGLPETATDAEGNTIEATDEEKAAALADAKKRAEDMVAAVKGGEEFDAIAQDYVSETSKDAYSTPDYTLRSKILGSNLSSVYQAWLQDAARKPGDVECFESSGTGYMVIQYEGRGKDDSYTVDVRHILITPEGEEGSTEYTDEQWDAAQARAQEILDQFLAGEQTAEAFGALAEEYSQDGRTEGALNAAGGQYTDVSQGDMVEQFNDWIFSTMRQQGDTGLVKTQFGWHVMYFETRNSPAWQNNVQTALVNEAVNAWLEEQTAGWEMTEGTGSAHVGD